MFFWSSRRGLTSKTAQYLLTRLPTYMALSTHYEVVTGPVLSHIAGPPGEEIYMYCVREQGNASAPNYYILTPFILPPNFWCRMITTWLSYLEILPSENDGEAWHIKEARKRVAA